MAENNPQSTSSQVSTSQETVHLPRIAIKYCTQCKWMLRAAYVWPINPFPVSYLDWYSPQSIAYVHTLLLHSLPTSEWIYETNPENLPLLQLAQELLSTFSTSLGEVSLIPSTGGVFSVTIATCTAEQATSTATIWDRKADGGFPGEIYISYFHNPSLLPVNPSTDK